MGLFLLNDSFHTEYKTGLQFTIFRGHDKIGAGASRVIESGQEISRLENLLPIQFQIDGRLIHQLGIQAAK